MKRFAFLACLGVTLLSASCDKPSKSFCGTGELRVPIFVPTSLGSDAETEKLAEFIKYTGWEPDGTRTMPSITQFREPVIPPAVFLDLRKNGVSSYRDHPIRSEDFYHYRVDRKLLDEMSQRYAEWVSEKGIDSRYHFLISLGAQYVSGFFHINATGFKGGEGMMLVGYNAQPAYAFWGDRLPAEKEMSTLYLPPSRTPIPIVKDGELIVGGAISAGILAFYYTEQGNEPGTTVIRHK